MFRSCWLAPCLSVRLLTGVCVQGAEVDLGRGEADELGDVRDPAQAQQLGPRRLPRQRLHGAPRRAGATNEQRLLRAAPGCPARLQGRLQRRPSRPGLL